MAKFLSFRLISSIGDTATEEKRALPALAMSVLKNPKVQEAVVDKGLDVMNKLVDKQLKIIDEAQEKASKFLAKEVSGENRDSFVVSISIVVQVAKPCMAGI